MFTQMEKQEEEFMFKFFLRNTGKWEGGIMGDDGLHGCMTESAL